MRPIDGDLLIMRASMKYPSKKSTFVPAIAALVRETPSIEPKQGEWVQHYETTEDGETLPYGWECSVCGRWEIDKEPYCNCGARMFAKDTNVPNKEGADE